MNLEDYIKSLKENMPEIKYTCHICGTKISFDEAYLSSGKYCPNCDANLNIPYSFWE